MSDIRNQNWYVLNSNRSYPIDEASTLTDDAGIIVPHNIIVDLNLRFPRTVGRFVYISSLAVTPYRVTVTFLAVEEAVSPATMDISVNSGIFTPIAVVTVKNPEPFRVYSLSPQYPGVSGHIVFGLGVREFDQSLVFSSFTQSAIVPKAASFTTSIPVSSLALVGGQKLTGIVTLKAGNDIEIVKECRQIPVHAISGSCDDEIEEFRDVIVIRLKNSQPEADRNVLDLYKGPCGGRPESRTCNDPQPIETINGIGPDCCGNVTIRLKGCAEPAISLDNHNVILSCNTDIDEICTAGQHLPAADGTLPNEYTGDCEDSIIDINLCEE